MKTYNIPSASPELGNDDFFSHSFFLESDYIVRSVLKDNYPWVYHTFKKMAGEIKIDPFKNATYTLNKQNEIILRFNIQNIGLQKWEKY